MSTTEAPPAYEETPRKSLAQQILEANDVETTLHDVPEWGVKLELRSPTGEERAALVSSFVDMETGTAKARDLRVMYPALVITCAYDPETGERVFEQLDEPTKALLNAKRGDVLERIAMACMPLVGLTPESVDEAKDGSSTSPQNGNATP